MKKIAGLFAVPLVFGTLLGVNFIKHYKPGDFIPEENAYFGGEITNPAGHIKAHKYVTPSDNKYNSQKTRSLGTGLIGDIESVWSSYTGSGTTIAVIDDGFDYDHPEYRRSDGTSAILSTSRYYYESGNSYLYQEYSDDPTCIGEDWESDGQGGYEWATHGTATSTTAAAPMGNGGGVGIAPEADILALKIDFSFAAINGAIRYAVDQGADVINMSLGAYAETFTDGWGDSQSGSSAVASYLESACQYAYNHGVIVVAAAGNESTWHKSYPACNYKVVGVGALGDWDNKGNATALAEFTNYVKSSQTGEINVDILAPGYVYTAERQGTKNSPTHTYADTQGTSFSCPIIAGAACLWKQKYPSGTPDQFLAQLQSSADGTGYYTNKYVPVSGWDSSLSDVGPSAITNGRLNVANLLDINDPYVSTVQSNFSISVGEKRQIDLENYNGTISYSSSNTNIATVTNNGLIEGVGAGDATITVTASKNNKTATATINVHVDAAIAATSLSFSPKSVTLTVGETYDSEATISVTPNNASRIFLFESENPSVATVDIDTGLVTAIGVGTTNVNVIAGFGDGDDTLSVTVEAPTGVSDTLTRATTGVTDGSTTYTSWSGKKVNSDAVYAGQSAGGNNSIQLRSNNSNSGIVTTTSGGQITKIIVDWNSSTSGRTLNVYGKNTAYTSASDLYGSNSGTSLGSIDSDSSTELVISGNYSYVGVRSSSGAMYIDSITFEWNGSSSAAPTVTGVTLSKQSMNLDLSGTSTGSLSATVNGTNSPSQAVNWSSSNTSIATYSNGTVTAHAVGSATITATSVIDSTKSASCTVTVIDSNPKTLSSISISGYKTNFNVGDTFSFGGTVTATYSDNSTENVTSSCSFSGYNMSSAGTHTVTVSYTYGGVTKTATYQISVAKLQNTTYTIGWGAASGTAGTYTNFTAVSGSVADVLSFTTAQNGASSAPAYNSNSNELRLYYQSSGNGGSITITPAEGVVFTGFVMKTSTSPSVKYSVDGGSATSVSCSSNTYTVAGINVTSSLMIKNANTSNTQLRISTIALTYSLPDTSDKVIDSLSASYSGSALYVGDELDTSKISVTASFTDSVKYPNEVLKDTEYEMSGFNSSTQGVKNITITYTGALATSTTPLTTMLSITVNADSITSVDLVNERTYHPGETISKSDISMTIHFASGRTVETTDFTFSAEGYRFTYEDTNCGGNIKTKQFSVIYDNQSYNFNVNVSREAYVPVVGLVDNLTYSLIGKSGTTYGNWSNKTATNDGHSNAKYAGNSAGGNNSIQIRSKDSNSGIVSTTSGGKLAKVSVVWNENTQAGRVLNIYGKNTAYEAATDLYDNSKKGTLLGTIVYGTSTELDITGDYTFVGIQSDSGAVYLDQVDVSYGGKDSPIGVSNYIMYEDTNGQCLTKLDLAIDKLNTMSSADKSTFWTSNDYVIATARERLEAWARHEGKTLNYTDGSFVANSNSASINQLSNGSSVALIIILSLVSVSLLGGYLLIKKKKEQ